MIERHEEETVEQTPSAEEEEEEVRREEERLAEEKPVDADSEVVPNKNLTDDEIAQLILEEEELLSDRGLLGYIFTIAPIRSRRSRATVKLHEIIQRPPPSHSIVLPHTLRGHYIYIY